MSNQDFLKKPVCGTANELVSWALLSGAAFTSTGRRFWRPDMAPGARNKRTLTTTKPNGPQIRPPRSAHIYLNTAPDSASQANRLACSPTSGFLSCLKVVAKSGQMGGRPLEHGENHKLSCMAYPTRPEAGQPERSNCQHFKCPQGGAKRAVNTST